MARQKTGSLEPKLPTGKVPINTSKTPATGGKLGVKMAQLGPTPVGVHGPEGVHAHIKGATSVSLVTPNKHSAELVTPAVGVRNTPTKKK